MGRCQESCQVSCAIVTVACPVGTALALSVRPVLQTCGRQMLVCIVLHPKGSAMLAAGYLSSVDPPCKAEHYFLCWSMLGQSGGACVTPRCDHVKAYCLDLGAHCTRQAAGVSWRQRYLFAGVYTFWHCKMMKKQSNVLVCGCCKIDNCPTFE